MANPMLTGNFSELVGLEILQEVFTDAWNKYPSVYKDIYNLIETDLYTEKDLSIAPFGLWGLKGEGEGIVYTDVVKGRAKTYTQQIYSTGFKITDEMMSYDRTGTVKVTLPRLMAEAGKDTLDYLGSLIFIRATSGNYLGPDAKALCADDHPLARGGTVSNIPAAFMTLSRTNLDTAIGEVSQWVNGAGIPIKSKIVQILTHPTNQIKIEEILNSDKRSDTGETIGLTNVVKKFGIQPVYDPNLDTDAWFLLCNDLNRRRFKAFVSKNPTPLEKGSSTGDFDGYYKTRFAVDFDFSDLAYADIYCGHDGS